MDSLTHLLVTRKLLGTDRDVLIAGIAPDLPFYLTYPPWLIIRGQFIGALKTNEWPEAPIWMYTAHHVAHSFPVVLAFTLASKRRTGHWPRWCAAWALHILIDIPTHSRKHWGPRFLWPLSDVTVDGISWPELLLGFLRGNQQASNLS
jgi:hypothetical protein